MEDKFLSLKDRIEAGTFIHLAYNGVVFAEQEKKKGKNISVPLANDKTFGLEAAIE